MRGHSGWSGRGRAAATVLGGLVTALALAAPAAAAPTDVSLFEDINTAGGGGPASHSNIEETIVAGGRLFFSADDGVHGNELWVSDGLPFGTRLVEDIYPGAGSGAAFPSFEVMDGIAYFIGRDPTAGYELWRSDGTEDGTFLLKDFNPGPDSSELCALTAVGNTLYATAWAGDGLGSNLYKSDGTPGGTSLVKDIPGDAIGCAPARGVLNGELFFMTRIGDGLTYQLWKSNGTGPGTTLVKDFNAGNTVFDLALGYTNFNGSLYFSVDEGTAEELWKTDGTPGGTVPVADIFPGPISNNASPSELRIVGGSLFFDAEDATAGRELWRSDGTGPGTQRVADINPGAGSSDPEWLTPFQGGIFFRADNGVNGVEIWRSDGTAAGTQLFSETNPGPADGFGSEFTPIGDSLVYGAVGPEGFELRHTDGTAAGTGLLADINPGPPSSNPFYLTPFAGALFFRADDGVHGSELWRAIDPALPETTITSGPANGEKTSDSTPTFGFSSSLAGSLFECRYDGGAFAPCATASEDTPANSLSDGAHTFEVRAVAAGHADPTPASRAIVVDTVIKRPRLKIRIDPRQRPRMPWVPIILKATPKEDLTAKATAMVKLVADGPDVADGPGGKRAEAVKLKSRRIQLTAGEAGKVKLKATAKKAAGVADAIAEGETGKAKIKLTLVDDAGNSTTVRKGAELIARPGA